MDAPTVDSNFTRIAHNGFSHTGHFFGRLAGMKVGGLSVQMVAVCDTADGGIMAGAAHSGAASVHDTDRNAQSAPDLVTDQNQFFFRLYRESITVFPAALAAELLPDEKFAVIPEGAGGRDIRVLIRFVPDIIVGHILNRFSGRQPFECGVPGTVSKIPILRDAKTMLELPGSRCGLLSPDAVYILNGNQIEAAQNQLLLLCSHNSSLCTAPAGTGALFHAFLAFHLVGLVPPHH
jgi:hypothetical protein